MCDYVTSKTCYCIFSKINFVSQANEIHTGTDSNSSYDLLLDRDLEFLGLGLGDRCGDKDPLGDLEYDLIGLLAGLFDRDLERDGDLL